MTSWAEGCRHANRLLQKGISVNFGRSLLLPGQLQLQLGILEQELTDVVQVCSSPVISRLRPGFIPANFTYSIEESELRCLLQSPVQ